MRPTPSTETSSPRINIWNSPIPYLFGGLALVLLLIALSLALLVCSYQKYSSSASSSNNNNNNNTSNNGNDDDDDDVQVKAVDGSFTAEQPKIVVIMAGDEKPTCLAMPASTCRCNCNSMVKVKI